MNVIARLSGVKVRKFVKTAMIKTIPIANVVLDKDCQPRAVMSADLIGEYCAELKVGAKFPPIKAIFDGQHYWCYDGFHRIHAQRLAANGQRKRWQMIRAEVSRGTRRDAILLSFSVNCIHGQRRTNADKRNAVERVLADPEWSKKSNRWLAEKCVVDPQTVANIRQELQYRNSAPSDVSTSVEVSESEPDTGYLTEQDSSAAMPEEPRDDTPPAPSVFNAQDTTSIEWARWSWNPVTGCEHNCPYCYARDIAERFYPQKFKPTFLPERLTAPANTKVPARAAEDLSYMNVFTCSMADLFGRWVPRIWIEAVLDRVRNNPQWNFLFLTKFPQRYCEFEFPTNAWMGTTVDLQARVANAEKAFAGITGGTKWLSLEPLLDPLKFTRMDLFDWVVIGGASPSRETPAWTPPLDWLITVYEQARAAGCKVYFKDNCGFGIDSPLRLREFPWIETPVKELPTVFQYLKRDSKGAAQPSRTIALSTNVHPVKQNNFRG